MYLALHLFFSVYFGFWVFVQIVGPSKRYTSGSLPPDMRPSQKAAEVSLQPPPILPSVADLGFLPENEEIDEKM